MGGYGSGRLSSRLRKVEECLQLHIREFAKASGLRAGERKTGQCYAPATPITPSLLIAFEFDAQAPEPFFCLSYVPPAGGGLVTVRGPLLWSVAGTGDRCWWACPECKSCRGILYLPPGESCFACRACHRLRYASTAMTQRARLEWQAQKLYRLAGSKDCGASYTPRPRGMRRATFHRLMDRAAELDRQAMDLASVPRLLVGQES